MTILIISLTSCQSEEVENTYDIVVYGGTSAGISAAIQSSRMGKSVVLIEPTQKDGGLLGGLTTGGLGATDIGNKQAIGGISREFYERIAKKYTEQKEYHFHLKTRRSSTILFRSQKNMINGPYKLPPK